MKSTLALLAIFAAAFPAWGHGGGLDGYGCHHNRKAGGYHCHRGPLAGQSFATKEEMLQKLKTSGRAGRPYGGSASSSIR